jgi:predicted neuraminidase
MKTRGVARTARVRTAALQSRSAWSLLARGVARTRIHAERAGTARHAKALHTCASPRISLWVSPNVSNEPRAAARESRGPYAGAGALRHWVIGHSLVIRAYSLVILFLLVGSAADAANTNAIISSGFIYESAPFPQCHASTIVETKSGLVCAWFGGTKEGNPDVGIWLSRHIAGKWTAPVEVANGAETETPRVNCLNPVLFQVEDGPLMLFYKTGKWWAYVKRSTDGGVTWSAPERLYNGFFGPVKNKPVRLADGSILSPTSSEFATPGGRAWQVHFERSTDGGKTWQFIGPVNDGQEIAAIQPSILIHGGGRLQALGRTQQGKIYDIWSEDNGLTWGKMSLLDLPNNNSGTDAVTLKDGRHLLVYNHTGNRPGETRGYRSPLNVAVSKDGKTWESALVLEDEPRKEFSYPAVIQTADGRVHITYTWKRERVRHVVVDAGKLTTRPMVKGEWPK